MSKIKIILATKVKLLIILVLLICFIQENKLAGGHNTDKVHRKIKPATKEGVAHDQLTVEAKSTSPFSGPNGATYIPNPPEKI